MPHLLLVEQQTNSVLFTKPRVKLCEHSTFAFASTSPSKFNIASMETQTQTHRMGLNPFLTFYIDAMLNVDASAKVKCEHSSIHTRLVTEAGEAAALFAAIL